MSRNIRVFTEEDRRAELSLEDRVTLAMAVRRYLKARDRFQEANRECEDSGRDLREALPPAGRFVVEIDYRHWLLEIPAEGDFELVAIEKL